jgi:hypothetical protein
MRTGNNYSGARHIFATKAPRIATAKYETCPDCGWELSKGIMAEWRKLHPGGTRCPECPGARHEEHKPPTERARRIAKIQRELEAETKAEHPRLPKFARTIARKQAEALEAQPMALTPEVLADPKFISPGTRRQIERKADTRIRATTSTKGAHRLKAGDLQAAVLRFVQVHSDEEWSPTAIAAAIGRSSGAIANALGKHERDGKVRCTSTQPRRYQATAK